MSGFHSKPSKRFHSAILEANLEHILSNKSRSRIRIEIGELTNIQLYEPRQAQSRKKQHIINLTKGEFLRSIRVAPTLKKQFFSWCNCSVLSCYHEVCFEPRTYTLKIIQGITFSLFSFIFMVVYRFGGHYVAVLFVICCKRVIFYTQCLFCTYRLQTIIWRTKRFICVILSFSTNIFK